MNPVLIFIPVVIAIVLFFMFRPSKKEKPTVDVIPKASDPTLQFNTAVEPVVAGADPVEEVEVPAPAEDVKPKPKRVKKPSVKK
jgi:hypothetical protein